MLCAAGFVLREHRRGEQYRRRLQNQYSAALNELNSRFNNIGTVLEKTCYASSAKQISSYAAVLYSDTELAKAALSRLPDGGGELTRVYKLLSQVGNFAMSVSKSVIGAGSVTGEQRQSIAALSSAARTVSRALETTRTRLDNPQSWSAEINAAMSEGIDEGALAKALTEAEEDVSDYPTLIYDGPYSDHILNKKPLMLESAEEVDREYAENAARKMLGADKELTFDETVEGKISAYRFSGDNAVIAVSRRGGKIVYMLREMPAGERRLSYEQALSRAVAFMKENGFENMTETYYFTDNGVCVISFAFLDGQTVCYTDLIKVGVAMDSGEIVRFEASGYLTNHTERAFEAPAYSFEEAAAVLEQGLEARQTTLALIPTDGGGEVRCYEFLCKAENGEDILVYINAATLEGEQVLILLKSDGGSLVK